MNKHTNAQGHMFLKAYQHVHASQKYIFWHSIDSVCFYSVLFLSHITKYNPQKFFIYLFILKFLQSQYFVIFKPFFLKVSLVVPTL